MKKKPSPETFTIVTPKKEKTQYTDFFEACDAMKKAPARSHLIRDSDGVLLRFGGGVSGMETNSEWDPEAPTRPWGRRGRPKKNE